MRTRSRRVFAATAGTSLLALTLAAVPVAAQDGEADHLQRVMDSGRLVMSTDALYKPQSFIDDVTGEVVGYDIDVGAEIANRLGVTFVPFPTAWDNVASGRWADRWDMSVGSMTITPARREIVDFTQVYRFDQAGVAVREGVEATSLEDLDGMTICVGSSTTYFDWLSGTLVLDESTGAKIYADPPEDIILETRETDTICASEWASGRSDTDAWVSAQATIFEAVAADQPVVPIGEAVFAEPLAVAFDNSVADNDSLVSAVDDIIGQLHEEGVLSELSEKWYGVDLSKPPAE